MGNDQNKKRSSSGRTKSNKKNKSVAPPAVSPGAAEATQAQQERDSAYARMDVHVQKDANMVIAIANFLKHRAFHHLKFITTDKLRTMVCQKAYNHIYQPENPLFRNMKDSDKKSHFKNWCKEYETILHTKVNQRRTDCQKNLKEVMVNYCKKSPETAKGQPWYHPIDHPLPKLEEFKAVVFRNLPTRFVKKTVDGVQKNVEELDMTEAVNKFAVNCYYGELVREYLFFNLKLILVIACLVSSNHCLVYHLSVLVFYPHRPHYRQP